MVVTVLRWIAAGIAGCSRVGASGELRALHRLRGAGLRSSGRKRLRRHWIRLLALFWFNVEVWGRVVCTHRHLE